MHIRSKAEHLDKSKQPKRMLALDGGGIRGLLTLQYARGIRVRAAASVR